MHQLVFESQSAGHRPEYIGHYLRYLDAHPLTGEDRVSFLVHPAIVESLGELFGRLSANSAHRVSVVSLKSADLDRFDAPPLQRAARELSYLRKYITAHHVDHLILGELDVYQIALGGTTGRRLGCSVSGILFAPYHQLPTSDRRKRLQRLRKRLQLHWMFLNRNIRAVFVLNDVAGVEQLNQVTGFPRVFRYLPDPVEQRSSAPEDVRERFGLPADRELLLFIGGVQRRKNILTILQSLKLLPEAVRERVGFLILGLCRDSELLEDIKRQQHDTGGVPAVFHNDFVSDSVFDAALQTAALTYTVYTDFYCSSGIVGQAAKHGTPLLATARGVIGDMVRQYRLGETLDEVTPVTVAAATCRLLNYPTTQMDSERFLREHTPQQFAAAMLQRRDDPAKATTNSTHGR